MPRFHTPTAPLRLAATALALAGLRALAQAQNVKVTPLGGIEGEFCAQDRALVFEDPNGTRLLYDPGRTVAGAADPAFRSVRLPDIGDGQFVIRSFDEGNGEWIDLMNAAAGEEILFGPGGIRRFRVMGIEAGANLDPNDPTAFVTGVSFVASGQFTGRMIAVVPEPSTWALALLGAGLLSWQVRTRSRTGSLRRGA